MPIENFLQGFFETGAGINIEKSREERALKKERILRAERNAEELKAYTDRLVLKTKAERDSAEAKERRRQKQYNELMSQAFPQEGTSATSAGGEQASIEPTLQQLYDTRARVSATSIGFDDDIRDTVLDNIKTRIEAKENENKPVGSAISSEISKIMDGTFLPDKNSTDRSSPLFLPGVKVPLIYTEAELKGLGTSVEQMRLKLGSDNVEEIEEGVYSLSAQVQDPKKTARELRPKMAQVFYETSDRARSLTKDLAILDGNPSINNRDITDAFVIERAVNSVMYSKDTSSKKIAKETIVNTLNKRGIELDNFLRTPSGQRLKESILRSEKESRELPPEPITDNILRDTPIESDETIPPPPSPPTLPSSDGPKPISSVGIKRIKDLIAAKPDYTGEDIMRILDKGGFTITEDQLKEIFSNGK